MSYYPSLSDQRPVVEAGESPSLLNSLARTGAAGGVLYAFARLTGRKLGIPAAIHAGTKLLQKRAGVKPLQGLQLAENLKLVEDQLRHAPNVTVADELLGRARSILDTPYKKHFAGGERLLTVGEAVGSYRGQLPTEDISLLEKYLSKGWISTSQAIDPAVSLSKGKIRDVRLLSSYGTDLLAESSSFFGLPRVIGDLVPRREQFATLGYKYKGVEAGRFFYSGGDVLAAFKEESQLVLAGRGKKLYPSAGPLHLPAALRRGEAEFTSSPPTGLLDKVLAPLGLGRRYATRYTRAEQFIINPIRRRRAIQRGEVTLRPNEYRYVDDSRLTNLAFGGAIPEVSIRSGGARPIAKNTDPWLFDAKGNLRDAVAWKDIPKWERLKVLLGTSNKVSVITAAGAEKAFAGKAITAGDVFLGRKSGGVRSVSTAVSRSENLVEARALAEQEKKGILTTGGDLSGYTRPKFYASEGGFRRAYDFLNYSMIRLNSLISETFLGIGVKPSSNLLVNILRPTFFLPVAYETGRQAIKFADYTTEQFTGFSPIKAAAWGYSRLRLAQQHLREITGIAPGARFFEENFPGSISSGASFFLRTLVTPAAFGLGALMGAGGGKAFVGAAVGSLLAFGGPDPGQTPESLLREYQGQEKVARKKGRLWGLGYQPFLGGKITHYEHSWYHRLMRDADYRAKFGSKDEYFKHQNVFGIPFPTPWNLFGVRNLIDPYWQENQTYHTRPYPQTGEMFVGLGITGAILSDTIGRLIKPVRTMHGSELAGMQSVGTDLESEAYKPNQIASKLDLARLPISIEQPNDPRAAMNRIRYYAQVAAEPAGIYAFILEQFGIKLQRPTDLVATSEELYHPARFLEQAGLGGAFYQTEAMRRLLFTSEHTPDKLRQQYNPLRNALPDWLPGSQSKYPGDKSFYIDFHRGDAMTHIPYGEYRLPGPGYEAVEPLHSGQPGVYDAVDRFLILSDVAPYSTAFRAATKEVRALWPKLSKGWREKVENALTLQAAKEKSDVGAWHYTEDMADSTGVMPTLRHGWNKLVGAFNTIPYLGTKFGPARTPIEQYEREILYNMKMADWSNPLHTIVKPAVYDTLSKSPVAAGVSGGIIGGMLGGGLSFGMGPMFTPMKIPSTQAAVAGATIGAFGSLLLGGKTKGGFVPPEVQEIREAEEYFSHLKYLKARNIQLRAEELDRPGLARHFEKEARRTIPGAVNLRDIRGAIPREERKFFDAFLEAPESERDRIRAVVPGYIRDVLNKSWNSEEYLNTNKIDQHAADQAALEYFKNRPIPDKDSLLWHPDVNWDAIKIKMIQSGIGGATEDLHRFGYYDTQEREVQSRYPYLNLQAPSFLGVPNINTLRLTIEGLARRRQGVSIRDFVDFGGLSSNVPQYRNIKVNTPTSVFSNYSDLMRS